MAIVVTSIDLDQWVIEVTNPELDWLKIVSSRCCWDAKTTLSSALERGLGEMVLITQQVQGGFELTDPEEAGG